MLSKQDLRVRLTNKYSGTLSLVSYAGGLKKKGSVVQCAKHGKFSTSLEVLLRSNRGKNGCKECHRIETYSLKTPAYVNRLPSNIELVGDFEGMSTPVLHKCKVCGIKWTVRPGNILHSHSGCPACARGRKKVKLGGRKLYLRGYEPQGIKWLLKQGLTSEDIVTDNENIPKVNYVVDGKVRKYTPDLFLWKYNVLVEVKSLSTLGCISTGYASKESTFATNVAKARACIDEGYKFLLLVMTRDGRRLVLPQNWYIYSSDQLYTWAVKMGLLWEFNYCENQDFLTRLVGSQKAL